MERQLWEGTAEGGKVGVTAEERYAECKTIQELDNRFWYDKMSAETFEFLGACEQAYRKRLFEMLEIEKKKK